MKIQALSLLLLASIATNGMADDWPQWMGPEHDGLSRETGLQKSWPEGGPKQVWLNRDIGIGYSGPAIVGDRIYIMGSRNGTSQLICLATETGKEDWSIDIGPEIDNGWGNGPRGTPTVDGNRVYALAAMGNLICADASTGKRLWQVNMVDDFGGKVPTWGFSESPLVDGDLVLCTPGGQQGSIVALNKTNGSVVWRCAEMTDGAHYSSIVPINHNGSKQYIQLLPKHLVGLNPKNGEVFWQTPWPGQTAVIPTPLYRDGLVYNTSGYGVGCQLIRLGDDGRSIEVAYENKLMKNHHGGVLLVGDAVYGHSDRVGWLCQNFLTGDQMWRERSKLGKGAIAYADGHFYLQSESEGDIVLIEASTDGWQEKGRFTLSPQTELRKPRGRIWTHPVIANGRLYLRDQELFFSFDIAE